MPGVGVCINCTHIIQNSGGPNVKFLEMDYPIQIIPP